MRRCATKLGVPLVMSALAATLALMVSVAPAAAKPKYPVPCVVPNVVGKALGDAENLIKKANCKLGSVTSQTSTTVAKNHVISQNPPPGTSGPTVNLTVSLGKPKPGAQCKVPGVVGKSQTDATNAIVKANCSVGKVTQQTSSKPKGQVLSQSPAAGATGSVGMKVNLTISKGKSSSGGGKGGKKGGKGGKKGKKGKK